MLGQWLPGQWPTFSQMPLGSSRNGESSCTGLFSKCSTPSVEVQVGPATPLVCTYASWHHQTVPLGLTSQQGFQSWIHSASQGTSEVLLQCSSVSVAITSKSTSQNFGFTAGIGLGAYCGDCVVMHQPK